MELGLKGKCALVTGGSHGIGLAIAKALAGEGCFLYILGRDKPRLKHAAAEITAAAAPIKWRKGTHIVQTLVGDVLDPHLPKSTMRTVVRQWPALHILVNNVGGGGRWGEPVVENTKDDVWLDVYTKNTMAAVRFTMLAIPVMRQQRWGRVVTVSSIHGKEGGGRPWFTMAKSAEIAFMKSLAMTTYLARDGITFNSVAPGSIMIPETGWAREAEENPSGFQLYCQSLPLGRLGTPEEVAAVVAFLCSERASLVNGACIAIDGGEGRSF